MIDELELSNFKGFKKSDIRFKRITVFIGANGTGKSTPVQALLLLKQSMGGSNLVVTGQATQLGDFKDIVLSGEHSLGIKIIGILKIPKLKEIVLSNSEIRYSNDFEFLDGLLVSQSAKISLDDQLTIDIDNRRGQPSSEKQVRYKQATLLMRPTQFTVGIPIEHSGFVGSGHNNEINKEIGEIMPYITNVLSNEMRNLFVIPAIRGFDAFSYPLGDKKTDDFGEAANPEERARKVATTLAYSRDLEDKLSNWFDRITGIKVRFNVVPNSKVAIVGGTRKPEFNIVNEGFGSNQLTFALAQLAVSPERSIICYEEPEIHLHPKAQSELATILVEIAKEQDKQIILTTHSEHILYSLLTNIASKRITPNDLAIWCFSKKDGEIQQPKELSVDEKGRVEGGLIDFFEADLDALKKYLNAFQS